MKKEFFKMLRNSNESFIIEKLEKFPSKIITHAIEIKTGRTLLHFAVINNLPSVATWLIANNAHINAKDKFGQTPLHLAILTKNDKKNEVIDLLLKENADTRSRNYKKQTPVFLAALDNNFFLLKKLLSVKTRKKRNISSLYDPDIEGVRLSHLYAENGYLNELKEAILASNWLLNEKDDQGRGLIHYAAVGGQVAVTAWLISQGADVNALDDKNRTPLFKAVEKNNLNFIKYLIRKNANTKILYDDKNILHIAAHLGYRNIVEYLISNGMFGINEGDPAGNTPLYYACSGKSIETIAWLCQHSDIYIDDKEKLSLYNVLLYDFQGSQTKLLKYLKNAPEWLDELLMDQGVHYAALGGHLSIVRWLISERKININKTQSDTGDTPLHKAAEGGSLRLVTWLIVNGANPNIVNDNDQTPLLSALHSKLSSNISKQNIATYLREVLNNHENPHSTTTVPPMDSTLSPFFEATTLKRNSNLNFLNQNQIKAAPHAISPSISLNTTIGATAKMTTLPLPDENIDVNKAGSTHNMLRAADKNHYDLVKDFIEDEGADFNCLTDEHKKGLLTFITNHNYTEFSKKYFPLTDDDKTFQNAVNEGMWTTVVYYIVDHKINRTDLITSTQKNDLINHMQNRNLTQLEQVKQFLGVNNSTSRRKREIQSTYHQEEEHVLKVRSQNELSNRYMWMNRVEDTSSCQIPLRQRVGAFKDSLRGDVKNTSFFSGNGSSVYQQETSYCIYKPVEHNNYQSNRVSNLIEYAQTSSLLSYFLFRQYLTGRKFLPPLVMHNPLSKEEDAMNILQAAQKKYSSLLNFTVEIT